MVYLFDRPILPLYNKGKNLYFVVIIFHQIYFNKATASLSLCKLREERENRLPWQLISRPPDAFLRGAGIPGVALTLNPRLKALGLKPSAFNLSGWIPPNATRQYKTQIITNMALINTIMLCKSA